MILDKLGQPAEEIFFQFGRELSILTRGSQKASAKYSHDAPIEIQQPLDQPKRSTSPSCQSLISRFTGISQQRLWGQKEEAILPKSIAKNKVYVFSVKKQENEEMSDTFIIWLKGMYSVGSKRYLKAKSNTMICMEAEMFILGNSELIVRGSMIRIRKKFRWSYLEGNMQSGNWIAQSCSTYLIK